VAELSEDQIGRYLNRIGLGGPLPATAQTLSAIHWAHLHTVPFENLSICPLEQLFTLDIPAIYEKVVGQHRGGFCFELNGLLAVLLESLGYGVERMAAHFADESDPDPFDHLVLVVTVPTDGSRWYVDVGAGGTSPDRPVPLDGISADGQRRVRLGDGRWVGEKRGEDGAWNPVLSWAPEVHELSAFWPRCAYFQTEPGSFFRSGALCSMLIPGGRATLAKRSLIMTVDGRREERELESNVEIADVLRSIFGIEIPVDDRWR
jgi:N-hydroxyarylamine O-acetyltransferase